eukprot:10737821-Karenia_brevis.AAC.1
MKDTLQWGQQEKGMLKCLAANGFWTFDRLRQCGYETDGKCDCCGVPQTLFHLLWECQRTRAIRDQWGMPPAVLTLVRANP